MLDLSELSSAFQASEVDTLAQAYGFSLSYFDDGATLGPADRLFLARLTIMAGAARCRQDKTLTSFLDAHALAAEIVDFFSTLKAIQALDEP